MSKELNCIMLIDDNANDNFYHAREIKKDDPTNVVITKTSGREALDYLKAKTDPHSDLIFLDINMPGMNGWEFLKEYNQLDNELKSRAIIMMLTTSQNPDDEERAKQWGFVSDYITKPLTRELMKSITEKYFRKA